MLLRIDRSFYRDEPQYWWVARRQSTRCLEDILQQSQDEGVHYDENRGRRVAYRDLSDLRFCETFNYNQLVTQLGGAGSWGAKSSRLGLLLPTALLFLWRNRLGSRLSFPCRNGFRTR